MHWRVPALFPRLRRLLSITGEQQYLALLLGPDVNRAPPELDHVAQGPVRVGGVQIPAVVVVLQEEFPAPLVVAVLDGDVGLAEVGHRLADGVADLLPLLIGDRPLVVLELEDEEVEIFAELLGQVVADEGGVILQFPDLKDPLAAEALLDVLEDLETDVVGVDRGAAGDADPAVELAELDELIVSQVELPHDPVVPERCPAFVHNLGLDDKVDRL